MSRFKTFVKDVCHKAYQCSGAALACERAARWSGKRFLTILLFHRVTDQIPEDGLTVSTARFREICRMLQRQFHVVSVSEISRLQRSGEPLPPRTVAITFDDCYHDNLAAAGVLTEHGLTASFFVPTAYIGTDHVFHWDRHLPRMPNLTWSDVREMASLGHEIGSHTVHHANLGEVPVDVAQREIVESKRTIEDKLGTPVRWLACPYGGAEHFRYGLTSYVQEAGYDGCLAGSGGFVYADSNSFLLPREAAPCFSSVLNLELHLRGCLDWMYAFKRRFGMMDPKVIPNYEARNMEPRADALALTSTAENR